MIYSWFCRVRILLLHGGVACAERPCPLPFSVGVWVVQVLVKPLVPPIVSFQVRQLSATTGGHSARTSMLRGGAEREGTFK